MPPPPNPVPPPAPTPPPPQVIVPPPPAPFPCTLNDTPADCPLPPPPRPTPPTALPYPSNTLVNDRSTIYLIMGDSKIPFTSMEVFRSLGYKLRYVIKGDTSGYRLPNNGYSYSSGTQSHAYGAWVSIGRTIYILLPEGLAGAPTLQTFFTNGGKLQHIVPANNADKALPKLAPLQANDPRVVR